MIMATISSHILDSVIGTHAAGIRVECVRRDTSGAAKQLFSAVANQQGRISEAVEMQNDVAGVQYELVFHSADYYARHDLPDDGYQIIQSVVLRLALPDAQGHYHLPIMLSPHSYSVWWSGAPPVDH